MQGEEKKNGGAPRDAMQFGGSINDCSGSQLKQSVNRFCDIQGNVNIDQLFEDIKELSGMITEVQWFYKAFIFLEYMLKYSWMK